MISMPEYRTEPLIVPVVSGLLPEGERSRRAALTSFASRAERENPRVPQQEVVCYECGRACKVPAAALSANCSHCHAHLKMTDVELRPGAQRLTVRTLGKVTVLPDAVLSQVSVVCGKCLLSGRASGTYRCLGKMRVSCDNCLEGSVQANYLEVERSVSLTLKQGATVDTLVIAGRVTGRIVARREVILRRGAELVGDCHAPVLKKEKGAVHRGIWYEVEPE